MKIKDMNKPHCPVCKIVMEKHFTMAGDQYICDNYSICGIRLPVGGWRE